MELRMMAATTMSESFLEKWQAVVDIMSELMDVPAGLIMRANDPNIEVYVSSRSAGNPYQPGDNEALGDSGLYCETVIKTRERLLVPDARKDPDWDANPDIKLGMFSYLGYPIVLPNGDVFGTICVLDNKENAYSERFEALVRQFKELLESHLAIVFQRDELAEHLKEIETLRGILPICSFCKNVRDDDGFWHAVESYLHAHSEVEFSHGVCPTCREKHYPGL
jgi:GAF domain-containing protein